MTQSELTMIHFCHRHLVSIPAHHHRFVKDMKSLAERRPFLALSRGQRQYISKVYHQLIGQPGLKEAV